MSLVWVFNKELKVAGGTVVTLCHNSFAGAFYCGHGTTATTGFVTSTCSLEV